MARDADDAAAMLATFAGQDPNDPTSLTAPVPDYLAALDGILGARGYRIGVDEAYLETGVDAETVAHIRAALSVFADLGAVLVPMKVPERRAATEAQMMITDTAPGVRGNSATGRTKPATLATGHVVQVPEHMEPGAIVRVDTRTGEYLGRAS